MKFQLIHSIVLFSLLAGIPAWCQQSSAKPAKPAVPAPHPTTPTGPAATAAEQDQVLPGDWGPELLYGLLSSSNEEAQYGLVRATFAAGPLVIPQLAEALKDDRTAEYAAQCLAFIGGDDSLKVLWKLIDDPRDLNLRRFTYGALAEYDSPQATDVLFEVINKSDDEPDRTVTEAALMALTVRTDPQLPARLLASEKKLQDVVIVDDLENAREVITRRGKYLQSPEGRKSGGSIEAAVHTYFIPALELPPAPAAHATVPVKPAAANTPAHPASPAPHPAVSIHVRDITFSPDKQRALARVVFEDPSALAYYDFVLQKRSGNWTLASVWLGPEMEKPGAGTSISGLGNRDSGFGRGDSALGDGR